MSHGACEHRAGQRGFRASPGEVMSSREEIERVRRESERLLRDSPPARPEPAPPREVPVVLDDPVQKWREEADAFDRLREQNRAAMRREGQQEREAFARARALDGAEARITALEARIAELEQHVATVDGLAEASAEFSSKVLQGFDRLDGLIAQLGAKITEMRALDDVRRGEIIDLPASPLIRKVN